MKVLVIRFSSIGDIVLTTPVVRNLKIQVDNVTIHYVTKKEYFPLLEENPYLDKIHLYCGHLDKLISTLRNERYDLIIDLHSNFRSRWIGMRLGVKAYRYPKLNFSKWLLTSFKINIMPNIHVVDRYMKTVKPLHVTSDNLGLDYFIPDRDEVEMGWFPDAFQNGYAAYVIGGKWGTKRLPLKRMIELCDRINKPVIVLGGKEDQETGEKIEAFFARNDQMSGFEMGLKELGKKTVVFNACGKFNLNQSASIIRHAKWVFSHDTGLMHIAAAFQKELFTIWGNTVPEFGMYPYKTKFTIFENKKISCRPCSKIGYENCPKGHFLCMEKNNFDFYLPD